MPQIVQETKDDDKGVHLNVAPNEDLENKGQSEKLPLKTNENGEVTLDEENAILMQINLGFEDHIDPEVILTNFNTDVSPSQETSANLYQEREAQLQQQENPVASLHAIETAQKKVGDLAQKAALHPDQEVTTGELIEAAAQPQSKEEQPITETMGLDAQAMDTPVSAEQLVEATYNIAATKNHDILETAPTARATLVKEATKPLEKNGPDMDTTTQAFWNQGKSEASSIPDSQAKPAEVIEFPDQSQIPTAQEQLSKAA